MIANLLIMVIIGGYETFVSRINLKGHPDQPEWLSHVNANVLKVKLAMAIVGISSIHLLQTFINAANTDSNTMLWQTVIHVTFVDLRPRPGRDRPLPLPQTRRRARPRDQRPGPRRRQAVPSPSRRASAAQYGGRSSYQTPSVLKARQKRCLAPSSSSESSMSGT